MGVFSLFVFITERDRLLLRHAVFWLFSISLREADVVDWIPFEDTNIQMYN